MSIHSISFQHTLSLSIFGCLSFCSLLMMSRAAVLLHAPEEDAAAEECCTSNSSSSIGRNSDVSSERSMEEGENEVESAYHGPLHAMETLEEVLPIRYTTAHDFFFFFIVSLIKRTTLSYDVRFRSFTFICMILVSFSFC